MPLKCQDPDTGVHTCTIAHSHRHTHAHRHAHMCRLLRADSYRNLGVHAHGANLQASKAPWTLALGPELIQRRSASARGRFLGKLTEMPVTCVTRLLEEGGSAPRWDRRALHQAGKDLCQPPWAVPHLDCPASCKH